jgi:uncharacterized repeat protein (TIGR03803 family)
LDTTGHRSTLHEFAVAKQGGPPNSALVRDAAGKLYGSAVGGKFGDGIVYELDPAGHETVLYTFKGSTDGRIPAGGVALDSSGNLYGATLAGGASDLGVVFEIDSTGRYTVLHAFTGGADGGNPHASVILGADGYLYGTTWGGGPANCGIVFRMNRTGVENVLYTFTCGADGGGPFTTLELIAPNAI